MKKITNFGKSIRTKLLNLAQTCGISYQILLVRYIQERLLYRLAQSEYRRHFVLKGGALLYAIQQLEARPTLDLDFMGRNISHDTNTLKNVFQRIAEIEYPEDAVTFDSASIITNEIAINRQYHGVRVQILAYLDTIRQQITMDIGFGDIITPNAQELVYPLSIDGLNQAHIYAYSIESVIAEKFEAMISLGEDNSRMKDFFDVYTLLHRSDVNIPLLEEAIRRTFENRNTLIPPAPAMFSPDFAQSGKRLTQWRGFLKKIKQNEELPFHEVHEFICDKLMPLLPPQR